MVDRLRPADAPALSRSHSDPDNARYQGWQSPLSQEEALAFIEEQQGEDAVQFAIREELGGTLAGDLYVNRHGQTVEIGITLVPGFHGRGLATAAVQAVVDDVLRREGVERVAAIIDVPNVRSRALFERLGFRLVEERDGEVEVELRRSPAPDQVEPVEQ
ncbi:MAG: GNAT family N-acetyltransferase [Actinomycetota bacterium]